MAKRKGSTRLITPLHERNPELFAKIKDEIAALGIENIAHHGTISRATIYRFIDGNEGLSAFMEGELQASIKKTKLAQQEEVKKIDKDWEAVLTE